MRYELKRHWWIGAAAGTAAALGAVAALDVATQPAAAQAGAVTITQGQLLINQRIAQAAVRRSNTSLRRLDALSSSGAGASSRLPLSAVVTRDGTLRRGVGAIASARTATGAYKVTFNRDVGPCVWSATVAGEAGSVPNPGVANVVLNPDPARTSLSVRVYALGGAADGRQSDRPFHLMVACG